MVDKMENDRRNDMDLEPFFAATKGRETPLPHPLMARVMADADAVTQSRRAAVHEKAQGPRRRRSPGGAMLTRVLAAVGGWPAVAGLASATLAGLWIGVQPPVAVQNLAAGLIAASGADSYLADVMPQPEEFPAEG